MKKASRLALSDLLEIAHMRGVEASVGGSGSPTASASAAASSASSGPTPGLAAAVGPPPLPPALPEAAPQALPGAADAQQAPPEEPPSPLSDAGAPGGAGTVLAQAKNRLQPHWAAPWRSCGALYLYCAATPQAMMLACMAYATSRRRLLSLSGHVLRIIFPKPGRRGQPTALGQWPASRLTHATLLFVMSHVLEMPSIFAFTVGCANGRE